MVKIIFRGIKAKDLKDIIRLSEKYMSENYDVEIWKKIFTTSDGNKYSFVAMYANNVIGYIVSNKTYIISMCVDKKFRGNKIGRNLIAH